MKARCALYFPTY